MDKSVKVARVSDAPAGHLRRDPARGGEFSRMMGGLWQLRWELDMEIAALTSAWNDGIKLRRLNCMGHYEVVCWAIEELRSRYDE